MARPKPVRPRIHPYLSPELLKRFNEYVASRGSSESAIVAEALEQLMGGTGEKDVLYRRLDKMSRTLEGLDVRSELSELRQHVVMLDHLVRVLTLVWLRTAEDVPKQKRRDGKSVKLALEHIMAALTKSVASGRTLLDELPPGARSALAGQSLDREAEPAD